MRKTIKNKGAKAKVSKPKTAGPKPVIKKAIKAPAKETLKLTIDKLDSEGIGLATHEGKTALVQGAFPGETVVVQVEHIGKTHIYTQLVKVLRNAPQRTANSPCKIEQRCLGCSLVAMKYPAQLDFKKERVLTAFNREGLSKNISIEDVLPSAEPTNYRASAKLVFGRKREQVKLGLYQRGSHDVIDCPECPVHHPLINKIAAIVREEVQRQRISVYNPQHQNGLLRYLMVRVSPTSEKALVTFVCHYEDKQYLPKLAKWLMRKAPEVIGVHQNINSSGGNVIIGQETRKVYGLPDLIDQVGDIKLRMSPESFFQVNTAQAAKIYALVRNWAGLTRQDTAIDLFCGIGGIALHLAQDAGNVFGIEYVPEAVRNAAENARFNNLLNCRFQSGDAAIEFQKVAAAGRKPKLVAVNPPRKGCSEELLHALGAVQPEKIIYVSCDPDSLARDLAVLSQKGYQIDKVQPVDMFPQTAHIETVVQLTVK